MTWEHELDNQQQHSIRFCNLVPAVAYITTGPHLHVGAVHNEFGRTNESEWVRKEKILLRNLWRFGSHFHLRLRKIRGRIFCISHKTI